MKIKLDENLPTSLASSLQGFGHDVHTVHEEDLVGGTDREIWEAAQTEARFLVTQDLDFSDLRQFAPGTHHGILLVRLHAPSRQNLLDRTLEVFERENVSGWSGCFIVATERKVRVVRPSTK